MTRRYLTIICIGCIAFGCSSRDHGNADAQESAINAIAEQRRQLYEAIAEEDLEKTMRMWAEDAVRFAPNALPRVGAPAIRDQFQQLFDACDVARFDGETKEIQVSGDWAYSLGAWALDLTCGEDPGLIQSRGHVVLLWRREAGGAWKITHDMFNEVPKSSLRPE